MAMPHLFAPMRGSVAVSGHLGAGKTTFLKRILVDASNWRDQADPELITTYVDFLEETISSEADFYRVAFSPQVCGTEVYDYFEARIVLERLHLENKHFMLCLDNFDWVIQNLLEDSETVAHDFCSRLRALISSMPSLLSLVVATREPLGELLQTIHFRGSPLHNSFLPIHLGELSERRARQLIAGAAGELFEEPELEFILKLEQRYPFNLLVACTYLAEAKKRGGTVNYNDVRAAYMDMLG